MRLLVYPVKDIASEKAFYRELLGVEPYAEAPYCVGFSASWKVKEIAARLRQLADAGAVTTRTSRTWAAAS